MSMIHHVVRHVKMGFYLTADKSGLVVAGSVRCSHCTARITVRCILMSGIKYGATRLPNIATAVAANLYYAFN